ncbi:MAG: hypothetical protein sL5_06900 [Candidatus Mesenet longicola]|uniref:Uncharacterized protein n=1 Tax=Candidatus Mesenet longicola TaxID=1892558 RepID=A0A8J3MQM0_9RICK|nr:MAG: hypothetical protein sGL2_07270 [Candidatus Mesenet longicola]GHM59697.1 MAG: hypothetical protein sL5_06900 [Candidatus Mesenet longicola]
MEKQNYKLYFYIPLFIFSPLTFAGSIYGLVIASTSSLILSCYIGFAVCSTFFVYKACHAVYNAVAHATTDKENSTKENDVEIKEKLADIEYSPTLQIDIPKLPEVISSSNALPPLLHNKNLSSKSPIASHVSENYNWVYNLSTQKDNFRKSLYSDIQNSLDNIEHSLDGILYPSRTDIPTTTFIALLIIVRIKKQNQQLDGKT